MHKYILLLVTPCMFAAGALATSSRDAEVLIHAQRSQLEYRQGNVAAAAPLVTTLEAAVEQSRDNADLWEALGHAYMSLQGSLVGAPPDLPRSITVGERARDAYARSLTLNPNDPLVLASHGMSQMVVSQLKGDGAGIMAGIDEMNAAVRQAPKSRGVRLTRGFTIIHLPPTMRDTKAVTEDLQFILDTAPGGRAEDVLHVMLGDVFAETGNLPAARREYAQVTGASAFAAEQVKLRAAADAVPPAAIAAVRMGTATCAMCHAPGTDD